MNENENNKLFQDSIQALREINPEPSPFLSTRVLAHHNEALQKKKSPLKLWIQILVPTIATTAIIVAISMSLFRTNSPEAFSLNQAYIVKADLREFSESSEIAHVTIELEGEVAFTSKKHNKISKMRSLHLSWEQLAGKQYLPVVVKGLQPGTSNVKIYFYDKNSNIIKTQTFDFRFQQGNS